MAVIKAIEKLERAKGFEPSTPMDFIAEPSR